MQFSHLFLAAAAILSSCHAAPSAEAGIGARAVVKLNQYRTFDDCTHDRSILYHAAPVSGKCYDLDDATGAYFLNTGGYLNCNGYEGKGCYSEKKHFKAYSGNCYNKDVASVECS
ncbi:hypothetical protein B0J14DRAFT_683344 [Halenospora varia]|nr:hypothetical protein B0J14DRAFT_683344 [Halenospora varia]